MSSPFQKLKREKSFSFFNIFTWFLAVLFFFYEFFLRVLPASAVKQILLDLNISIEQFALIGSGYYLTYSIMQFPVGILLDRFSAKLWILIAIMTCSLGTFLFGYSNGFISAFIGRLMIGFGSSFGFIFLMIVTLNWFPKKYFAFLIGCGQLLGALGPLCAGAPMSLVMESVEGGWRAAFFGVAVFGVFLGITIALFFREKSQKKKKIIFLDKKKPLKKRLAALLVRPQIWYTILFSGFIYVTLPLLGAFWGTTYLESRGVPPSRAALVVSMIWLGLALGSPIFGRLSDLMKRRKPILAICAILGLTSSILIFWVPSQNSFYLSFLFFLIGTAGSGQNVAFALITEHAPKNLRATALGMNNTAVMGFAAITPPFVTSIIRSFTIEGKLTAHAFEKGFAIIPIFFVIALILTLFALKETFCREQMEIHRI